MEQKLIQIWRKMNVKNQYLRKFRHILNLLHIRFYIPILNLFHINNFAMNIAQPESSSPQKTMRLFQMFAQSPTKGPIRDSPSKLRTGDNTFERTSQSPERKYNPHELLSYVSPFSPYLQSKSSQQQSQSLTDRYIPSRKLLKKQSLYQDEEGEENDENQNTKNETNNLSVADVYKKYIMTEALSAEPDRGIQVFQNNNILKYTTKNVLGSMQLPALNKNSSLQFAEELVNNSNKKRKIGKLPCKVLDAPALQDDYYLNLIDWSTQNYLAVGLSSSVYLWNANNSKVTKLCDLGMADTVTSVSWSLKGPHFSLGTNSGEVQIWDVNKMKRIRIMHGHSNRVGAIAWNSTIMSTGSRDKTILHRDLRSSSPFFSKLIGHKQQVCGLKWSFDEQQLCSGGNDNKLLIWNPQSPQPILKFCDHAAAVKAMAWSPHQHGLLVSGGGTADRTIRFRNTLTGTTIKTVDVGSQVCNLMFSKTLNQIVSTHGYSHNQINIWKYPKMEKVATLTGHTYRVLYLAMSPDGSTIVTGAGDQTLRFWNVFPNRNQTGKKMSSLLNIQNVLIR